eukprot:2005945-Rhodomonas_salina.2
MISRTPRPSSPSIVATVLWHFTSYEHRLSTAQRCRSIVSVSTGVFRRSLVVVSTGPCIAERRMTARATSLEALALSASLS